jgi:hypothetical protein
MASVLRDHIQEMHSRLNVRRSLSVLAQQHASDHHHYSLGHYHAGVNRGSDQRPAGWQTGEDAVLAESSQGRNRQ